MQINEPIIKDKEQNYIFRNKKITMLVKNGRLFCRIGGILKGFREYFEGINNSSKKEKAWPISVLIANMMQKIIINCIQDPIYSANLKQ